MDKYHFNVDALFKTIILGGMAALLGWLMYTQQLILYVNPMFEKIVGIATIVLALMGMDQLRGIIFVRSHGEEASCCGTGPRWSFLPFVGLLLLAVLIPNNTLNASYVAAKGLNMESVSSSDQEVLHVTAKAEIAVPVNDKVIVNDTTGINPVPPSVEGQSQKNVISEDNKVVAVGVSEKTAPKEAPVIAESSSSSNLIQVDNSNYLAVVRQINRHPEDYAGGEINFTGFVYKGEGTAANQFSLARYVITCCTSDALAIGLACETKDGSQYAEGTWLSIKGSIKMSKNAKPVIIVSSVHQIAQPQNPYIYWAP